MAKPIFIIRTFVMDDAGRIEFKNNMLDELENDYHILIYDDDDEDSFTFKMFSDHEIEPIELENLKEMISSKVIKQSPAMHLFITEFVSALKDKSKLTTWEKALLHSAEEILKATE